MMNALETIKGMHCVTKSYIKCRGFEGGGEVTTMYGYFFATVLSLEC